MTDVTASAYRGNDPSPRRLSRILHSLARTGTGPVTVLQIRDALGDRSFGALLAFFAAINLLPLPPGTTLVFGIPLIIISAQMLFGQRTIWLPGKILNRSVSRERFVKLTDTSMPRLLKFERLIRPRYWPFSSQAVSDRLIGLISLVLSIVVTLPIPLGNWLPSFAVFLIALSLSERDGIWLGLGVLTGLLSLLIVTAIVGVAGTVAASMLPF